MKINLFTQIFGTFFNNLAFKCTQLSQFDDQLKALYKGLVKFSQSNICKYSNLISYRQYCMGFPSLTFKIGMITPFTNNHFLESIKLYNGFGKSWRILTRNSSLKFCTSALVLIEHLFMVSVDYKVIEEITPSF